MEICHGLERRRLPLSATRRYHPEQIRALCRTVSPPFYVSVEGTMIALHGEECLDLACHMSSAYHNWLAYSAPEDDGFEADMELREELLGTGESDEPCRAHAHQTIDTPFPQIKEGRFMVRGNICLVQCQPPPRIDHVTRDLAQSSSAV